MLQEACLTIARILYIIFSNTITTLIQISEEMYYLYLITSENFGSQGYLMSAMSILLLTIGLFIFYKLEKDSAKTIAKVFIIIGIFILLLALILIL